MYSKTEIEYGPVIVIKGRQKGRIGDFDDETSEGGRLCGVIRFAPFGIAQTRHIIRVDYLRAPNTDELLKRHEELWRKLTAYGKAPLSGEKRIIALEEWAYVSDLLNSRMFEAQYMKKHNGVKIFLSHASADKNFVRGLAVDLSAMGHAPWLDEWEILGGESIPTRVAEGLAETDFAIVVLSENAVRSQWVENEWQAKYWAEINERRVNIIPVLLSDCEIPLLLKTKKYIDFRDNYSIALEELGRSLVKHLEKRAQPKPE